MHADFDRLPQAPLHVHQRSSAGVNVGSRSYECENIRVGHWYQDG